MKTIKFLALLAWAFVVANCLSCAPKAYPVESPNPLDEPGQVELSASSRHDKNIEAITSNPGHQKRQ